MRKNHSQRSDRSPVTADPRPVTRRPPWAFKRSVGGFSLLELMATLLVAAVILTVGVPNFLSFIANMRATSYANDLVLALNLARSEATRRGAPVRACSSTNGSTCNGTSDWTTGWIVRTDAGEVLQTWGALDGGTNIVVGSGGATNVRFLARGAVEDQRVLNVRIPNCTGDRGRDVSVGATGRVSVTRVDC